MAPRFRDGGEKITRLARALVIIVQTFAAVLINKYGAGSGVGLLIQAILNLAPLIPQAESDVLDFGGGNTVPMDDPQGIIGIDPGAPIVAAPAGE